MLGANEGEVVAGSAVQRAALGVLIAYVCAPIQRVGGVRYSTRGFFKKRTQSEHLTHRI